MFGTMYRRIRFSKSSSHSSTYHQQCLSFLMAGKCLDENLSIPEHKHVETFDRGGLWKVNLDVISIFSVAESYFLSSCRNGANNIDCKAIVTALLKDTNVINHFTKVRDSSPDFIKKEVAFNFLGGLLTLYVRVRVFSYTKNKVQVFKIQTSKLKSRSLRTSLKQKSTC